MACTKLLILLILTVKRNLSTKTVDTNCFMCGIIKYEVQNTTVWDVVAKESRGKRRKTTRVAAARRVRKRSNYSAPMNAARTLYSRKRFVHSLIVVYRVKQRIII